MANKTYNYNRTVREVLSTRPKVAGEVGIEIECEGDHLPTHHNIPEYWTTHADGSLRGESCEYVLAAPVSRDNIIPALDILSTAFKECKTKLKDSYRTSVHVHINMQTVPIRQAYNTILLYGILEDILTEYAGPTRTGNLFCLRMSDAEYMLHSLREAITQDYYAELNSNFLRYAGCNVKSLFDHNSLEFRAFRGTADMQLIAQWSDILLQIKDAALKYEHPAAIMSDFSMIGPEAFLDKIFTPSIRVLIRGFKDYQNRILDGVRLVQDVAFASDWAPTPSKEAKEGKKPKFYNVDLEAMAPDNPVADLPEAPDDWNRIRLNIPRPVLNPNQVGRRRVVPRAAPAIQPIEADINWPAARDEEI